jgi:hypothetical protein
MGLGIYSAPDESTKFTSISPFTVTFDGRVGGFQDKCIYIRNDDITLWYSDIVLAGVDTDAGDSRTDGTREGWEWKLLEKDVAPVLLEWRDIAAGNALSLSSNIGSSSRADISTFLPVWVHVETPRGQSIQTIVDIVLRLSAMENLLNGT